MTKYKQKYYELYCGGCGHKSKLRSNASIEGWTRAIKECIDPNCKGHYRDYCSECSNLVTPKDEKNADDI